MAPKAGRQGKALTPCDITGVRGGVARKIGGEAEHWQSTYGRGADSTETAVWVFGEHKLSFVFFSWLSSRVSDHAQS